MLLERGTVLDEIQFLRYQDGSLLGNYGGKAGLKQYGSPWM
jgi:hypothetical protein